MLINAFLPQMEGAAMKETNRFKITGTPTFLQIFVVCALLAVLILYIDLQIPLGVALGVPYVVVILISLWSPKKWLTVLLAVISSIFTIFAFFYKPPVADMWKVIFNRALALFVIWVTTILTLYMKTLGEKREQLINEREKTLSQIKVLQGLLPICSSCKKIRDDKGCWEQMEVYISEKSEALFNHSLCPECAQKLYPDYFSSIKTDSDDEKDR